MQPVQPENPRHDCLPILDYARPEPPREERVVVVAFVLAIAAIVGNVFFLTDTSASLSDYQSLWIYAMQRGHPIPPPDIVLGCRIYYGSIPFCLVAADYVMSLLLALILLLASILIAFQPERPSRLLWLYIRWKIVFGTVGALGTAWASYTMMAFTRHWPVGWLGPDWEFLKSAALGLATPLLLLWLLKRKRTGNRWLGDRE
jgi:hypothetical protein